MTSEGQQPLSFLLIRYGPDTLRKDRVVEEGMQQSPMITYADIIEVRTVTGATTCNQLLTDVWLLLGIYPLTTVADMTEGVPDNLLT